VFWTHIRETGGVFFLPKNATSSLFLAGFELDSQLWQGRGFCPVSQQEVCVSTKYLISLFLLRCTFHEAWQLCLCVSVCVCVCVCVCVWGGGGESFFISVSQRGCVV